MKKYLLLVGIAIMMGAGCAGSTTETTPTDDQAQGDTSVQEPADARATATDGLKDAPAADADAAAKIDTADWSKTTLRSGASVTVPVKGTYAPTWTYTLLESGDAHLQDGCYVTDATDSKRMSFAGRADVCLTTTAFTDGPGTRTDYFVFQSDAAKGKIQLFTFTKTYPAGFDMDVYAATIEKVIGLIS